MWFFTAEFAAADAGGTALAEEIFSDLQEDMPERVWSLDGNHCILFFGFQSEKEVLCN